MNTTSSIILSLGITLSGYFISTGIVSIKNASKVVEVRGLDERPVKANEGYLDLRISTSSNDLIEASKAMEAKQELVTTYLLKEGFSKEEIHVIPVTITDNSTFTSQDPNAKPPPKYTARGGASCGTYNVDLVGNALVKSSSLIEKGVLIESSFAKYLFTDLNKLKPEMLKKATQNARESAETFAKDAGVPLGSMRSASQGLFSVTAPNADFDDETSVMKKVRVVVKASYQLN